MLIPNLIKYKKLLFKNIKLNNLTFKFKKTKNNNKNKIKFFKKLYLKKKNLKHYSNYSDITNYILNLNITKSNLMFNITNTTGTPFYSYSAGLLNFKGAQKTKKFALINLLLKLRYKIINLKKIKPVNFSIHFHCFKKPNKNIINYVKTFTKINSIKIFNLSPFNGCRPKKKT